MSYCLTVTDHNAYESHYLSKKGMPNMILVKVICYVNVENHFLTFTKHRLDSRKRLDDRLIIDMLLDVRSGVSDGCPLPSDTISRFIRIVYDILDSRKRLREQVDS